MKYCLLLFFIFSTLTAFSQKAQIKAKEDSLQIIDLHNQLDNLKQRVETSEGLVTLGNSSVANQLSATNIIIAIIGVIFAVVTVGLGIYFNRIEARVKVIESRTQEKLNDIQKIEERVQQMQFDINNNISQIYRDLQRTELEYLLEKLNENFLLIADFHSRLMTFDIDEKYFNKFYEILEKLKPLHHIPNYNINEFTKLLWHFFWKKMLFLKEQTPMMISKKTKKSIIDFIIEYSQEGYIEYGEHYIKSMLYRMDTYKIKELCRLLSLENLKEVLDKFDRWTGQKRATPELHAQITTLMQEVFAEKNKV